MDELNMRAICYADGLLKAIRYAIDNYALEWNEGQRIDLCVEVEFDGLPRMTIGSKVNVLPKQWSMEVSE